jgi:DNA-binding MarR family transcriptional regulator
MSSATSLPTDATARVVAAWHRERPDLDFTPLEILSRVTRLAKHLDVVRRAVFEGHDLQVWEFDVLADLRRAGAPYELTPGQMTAQMLVSSGTMTNRIDRLEASGLVTRHHSTSDGRVTRVRLAEEGRERVDGAMADLASREAEILAPLSPQDREATARALSALLVPFEAQGIQR